MGQGKTENDVVRYMKSIGMTTLTNAGFNFRKMLVLLGFTVGEGKGSSTAIVKKVADTAVTTAPRATRTPAEAGANLRRITGKRPPV